MPREDWVVVAVSGATCSGKTSAAKALTSVIEHAVVVSQDDYFHDVSSEKHTVIPELNHINFEILSSIDMPAFKERIRLILDSKGPLQDSEARKAHLEDSFRRRFDSPEIVPASYCLLNKIRALKCVPNILILEGFLVLNDPELCELCDLKYFFTLDKATCLNRRQARRYEPPDIPGYFEQYVWPMYLVHYKEVLTKAKNVHFLDGSDSIDNNFRSIFHKLLSTLS